MKVIFDTNVWIASLLKDDSLHEKAAIAIKNAYKENHSVYITEDIIAESISVFKRLGQLEVAKTFVATVYENRDIEVIKNGNYFEDTVHFFLSSKDTKLSFVDMSLVVLSKKYKVITFDKILKRKLQKTNS